MPVGVRWLRLLAFAVLLPHEVLADQFKCYSLFDTATLKVRADTRGWIELEGKPRQEVKTFTDANKDQMWVFGPKQVFAIRPNGTGNLIEISSDTQVTKSPNYYCRRLKS
ncbi:MAG: hypothetical protein P8N99_03835 [Luminiphilus sp.]|nr:hypothetical protein [Luminiphilus sp.]MDG2443102.1 hypothetical protein [Luminiphilus sp.]